VELGEVDLHRAWVAQGEADVSLVCGETATPDRTRRFESAARGGPDQAYQSYFRGASAASVRKCLPALIETSVIIEHRKESNVALEHEIQEA
jgi:hypothetical protein